MVLEMRSWMHCLSEMQGVRKQVDCIKEKWETNTQTLMLRDNSAPRLEDVIKGLCFVPPWDLFGIAPIFPRPFRPICGGFQLEHHSPAFSAGWLIYRRV